MVNKRLGARNPEERLEKVDRFDDKDEETKNVLDFKNESLVL